ncbi:hypothetical protein BHE97_19085 [Aeromicrobium sp. PE09-221]|uniref:hypothetical protein n=1 Tax=Aeromicrobium sp. PE09-221 TaxID=1898043 RepID=UPI000B3E867B|nr:hypothetical protein [Aeromicrobium sp. PE09-221]OUZ06406.1 hypothetical protein BHE97_19085 [Aeromicrobium sp. PE09-221]
MPRRVNLPGADELFRATAPRATAAPAPEATEPQSPKASGRVKHDEKMTVYLTSEELLALEQARIQLRAELGRKIDRGRLVRAAMALALEDIGARGSESDIARRLADS